MEKIRIGVYSKCDFCVLYGVTMPTFEKFIAEIKDEIGWVKGEKQKFPPKIVRRILEYLGEPE